MIRLLLPGLVLAACVDDPAPAPRSETAPRKWGRVALLGLDLSLPADFTEGKDHGTMGQVLLGPEEDGFRVNAVVNRKPWPRGADDWKRHQAAKYERNPRVTLRARGTARVAGTSAAYLTYEEELHPVLTIEWYWWRDGFGYILRCTSPVRSFAAKWRPVFEEIARRVRHVKT